MPNLAPSSIVTAGVTQPTTAAQLYGVDIACVSGVGFVFGIATGRICLANALARRLITPRGGLFYDPDYGFDVRAYLNVALTRSKRGELVAGIEDECRKDARVQSVVATVTQVGFPRADLQVSLLVTPAAGPAFPLVLSIADLVAGNALAVAA